MSANFELDLEFDETIPKTKVERGTGFVRLLVVVGLVGLLIALMMPHNTCCNWPAARRSQCVNNLKQIALALRNYEEVYKALPPEYTVDARGRPLQSWRTLILPYLEQGELYRTIDLSKPWDDPVNARARETVVPVYQCPAAEGLANRTTYLAVAGPHGCFQHGKPRRLAEITDDHELTLMLFEAGEKDAVPWMAPVHVVESMVMRVGPNRRLSHAGGMNVCFVAGNVGFLKADTPVEVRRAMITISGNDDEVARKR